MLDIFYYRGIGECEKLVADTCLKNKKMEWKQSIKRNNFNAEDKQQDQPQKQLQQHDIQYEYRKSVYFN